MAGCQKGHQGTLEKHFKKKWALGGVQRMPRDARKAIFWAMASAKGQCGCWGMMG
jgi:hypothetical protein